MRGGRVVDPASQFDGTSNLVVQDGRILAWAQEALDVPPGARIIDATGQVVCPGFIDLHTHLRFPGDPDKETMASGTAAAAAGGFTTICAMANTNPVVDTIEVLREVFDEAKRVARVRVHQLAAVTRGLLGKEVTDFASLASAGAVAFSDDGKPVQHGTIMRRALEATYALDKRISVHEEDRDLVARGVANAGKTARRLSLPEWPCTGEAQMVARDIALLEAAGGHLHVAHVSCCETVDLVRMAKEGGLDVTAEATPHHLRLTDRLLAGETSLGLPPRHPLTKVNPPLRSQEDVDAIIEGLRDGTIDAVATDHAPHSQADKACSYEEAAFGISAIETALPLLLDLVRQGRIELPKVVERLTAGPARVFGLEGGSLRPGSPADLCIFDPDAVWMVEGERFESRGKNTPLLGARVTGRVTRTIVDGNVVYGADEL